MYKHKERYNLERIIHIKVIHSYIHRNIFMAIHREIRANKTDKTLVKFTCSNDTFYTYHPKILHSNYKRMHVKLKLHPYQSYTQS